MLASYREHLYAITPADSAIYDRVLPEKSFLLDALDELDWGHFEELVCRAYDTRMGQPSYPPLRMFKLEVLSFLYGLSDRQVIERASTDLLFRFFLQIGINAPLPHPSTLTHFRARLGADKFRDIFEALVAQARKRGYVKDRLRLTDATHVLASIAIPNTLELLAGLRDKLFNTIQMLSQADANGFRIKMDSIRDQEGQSDKPQDAPLRLQSRASLIASMLDWLNEHLEQHPTDRLPHVLEVRDLAVKIMAEFHQPNKKDRTLSLVDPDARTGFHHGFYDGYSLSVLVDADSSLITTLDVLPANMDEARNAVELIKREEQVHKNDIETLSIDGIGFHGPTLRELGDPEGLAINVVAPPRDFTSPSGGLDNSHFELIPETDRMRCPNGNVSRQGTVQSSKPNTKLYVFNVTSCRECPLQADCCPSMTEKSTKGRTVRVQEYEKEYQRAREKAKTEEYAKVRREHPMVERKFNEIANHYGGRRSRYWGLVKNKLQGLMIGFVMNLKTMLRLANSALAVPA